MLTCTTVKSPTRVPKSSVIRKGAKVQGLRK